MIDAPHNSDAERAVLGACLIESDTFDRVADILRPASFHVPAHRAMYQAITALHREQKPADPVLVAQLVGPAFASAVFEASRGYGTAANARHYAEVVRDMELRRAVREVAQKILRADVAEPGGTLVSRVANDLAALELTKGTSARPLMQCVIERLEELDKERTEGVTGVVPSGFGALDTILGGLHVGETLTIAARPGVGKTALVSAMADRIAAKGFPVGIFMLEDYARALADRAIARRARISSMLLRDGSRLQMEHWNRINAKMTDEWPVFVDDTHGRTIHDITAAMRRMVKEHGIRVFFLDNLSEVIVERNDGMRHDQELGAVARAFRDAAKAVNACPVLLVHLNREVSKRSEGVPHLSDLKNSGDIEDASHVVAMPWRPDDAPDRIRVEVTKNRNGPPGHVWLRWVEQFMEVTDA